MRLRQPKAAEIRPRMGRCYELALKTVYENPGQEGITLVHGLIYHPRTGYALHHAWVEFTHEGERIVYDTTMDDYLPKEVYYALFNAKPEVKYNHEECFQWGCRSNHCGPWHEVDWSLDTEDPREAA